MIDPWAKALASIAIPKATPACGKRVIPKLSQIFREHFEALQDM